MAPSRCHTRESGFPEVFSFSGFRVALAIASLPGMTADMFNGRKFQNTSCMINIEPILDQEACPQQGRRRVRQIWTIPPSLDSHRKHKGARHGGPAIGGNRWQQANEF